MWAARNFNIIVFKVIAPFKDEQRRFSQLMANVLPTIIFIMKRRFVTADKQDHLCHFLSDI